MESVFSHTCNGIEENIVLKELLNFQYMAILARSSGLNPLTHGVIKFQNKIVEDLVDTVTMHLVFLKYIWK